MARFTAISSAGKVLSKSSSRVRPSGAAGVFADVVDVNEEGTTAREDRCIEASWRAGLALAYGRRPSRSSSLVCRGAESGTSPLGLLK